MQKALKFSRQREHIIELMENTKCHPDANWIYMEMKKRFPNVSQATVYRNLKLLTETGMVIKISVGDGSEHYDITTKRHYHFVCEKCSVIDDVDIPVVDGLEREAAINLGAEIKSHSTVFYGICARCL